MLVINFSFKMLYFLFEIYFSSFFRDQEAEEVEEPKKDIEKELAGEQKLVINTLKSLFKFVQ